MAEKRIRSPNYPGISLPSAIERISALYKKQNRHAAPREVVAKSLGFGALSGPASTVISALYKYGLLERVGTDSKISERAIRILFPDTPDERNEAIRAAAAEPQLFAELNERFPGATPSDELLRNYLLRRNFSPGAIGDAILAFKETAEFVEQQTGGYDSPDDPIQEKRAMTATTHQADTAAKSPPPGGGIGTGPAPVIAIMEDGRLVVSATLKDRESVDDLIQKLTAIKVIAPPRSPTDGIDEP
jgi:hypothetical protein